MGSEYHKCVAELSTPDIEEGETKQIASGININHISNGGIKEEAIEIKPFSEYGVFHEKNGNEKFDNPNSIEFEVMRRSSVDCLKELKFSRTNFNRFTGELENHKVAHFNNGIILKNEDEDHQYIDDLLTNNVELKTETLKTEDDIDIVYEDVKHEICEEKCGKSESKFYPNSVDDILIGPDIGRSLPYELSIDCETLPQQNVEEDGTAVERDNHTRKEPIVTFESMNCQSIQKLPHCEYPKLYPSESKQELNEKLHTGEKSFQCNSSSHSFDVQHKKIHTGEKPYQCKIFAKKSNNKSERIHIGEKPFQCKICEKSFNRKGSFTVHERMHTRGKLFPCKICSKLFKHKSDLLKHERIHTGEKIYQCKICIKSFNLKSNLTIHERIHTGEKPFQCQFCEKSFNRKGNLTIHERIHTGEKPYLCKICSKLFNHQSDLLKHERIHIGKKPLQCEICLKSFNLKSNLTIHERIHTGEKPFQCQICKKSFNQKSNLTMHERIHTGKETFQCKICSKGFTVKKAMWVHQRIHAVEKPLQCKI